MSETNGAKVKALFEDLSNAIDTDKYNIADIIKAATMLIGDCIAQSDVSEEIEQRTYDAVMSRIKATATTLKEIYKED